MFKKVTKIALAGVIGVSMMVGSSSLVSAEESQPAISDAKVIFKYDGDYQTSPTDPVDPTDPKIDVEVDDKEGNKTGTSGPLSIDYVSHFNFGEITMDADFNNDSEGQTITAEKVTVTPELGGEGKPVAPYAQVTDKTYSNSGWVLSVAQQGQFKYDDEEEPIKEDKQLNGATIIINSAVNLDTRNGDKEVLASPEDLKEALNIDGSAKEILTAPKGTTNGTFVTAFGSEEDVTVKLNIPQDTRIVPDKEYKTTLEWTLTDADQG